MENEMISVKKKRGCNYTSLEKDILIDIVKGHINIVENKETNGELIKKKQSAWTEIAYQYNAVATSGPRTWVQLRHLYENIKQRTKKNVAKENRQRFYEKEKEQIIHDLKLKASHDKKQIIQTGVGAYKSVLTDTDNQLLAMVAPQIKPMKNLYDDAAAYFGDVEEKIATESIIEGCTDHSPQEACDPPSTYIWPTGELNNSMHDIEEITVEITFSNSKPIDDAVIPPTISNPKPIGKGRRLVRNGKVSKSTTKEQYFKVKLHTAKLERKFLIQRHKLEMELLRIKIRKTVLQSAKSSSTVVFKLKLGLLH